ncbi:MAG: sigma-70 family RNA polymerase sigma factor [Hamadaea sp.]|uniref:sigma-70 family RNA polymerase sigma factor n=1 Tax=Hamadaea sp. TaxID=2024425 RepID=UPI001844BC6F|nr:sigma-70 family RNA polymerase sigma factor [Hamadaea sp.]NUR73746.1 sigma-70 family RNA polymerase sigma factor [Hamadaea sp.]NUT23216.1 sigma-70 family RNA polymerase sigma factor [Hamadaea sp.]
MTVQIDCALNSDAELLTRVRGGDSDAYGELYRRHADAAKRLAVVLARDRGEAEDLAAEAFARVLGTLRAGGGPQTSFRPYLLTVVRNAFYDRVRRNQKVEPTDVIEEYERPEPYEDPSIAALERSYAARAFARLPERWRAVLWHTEVEGESPTQIAPLFGLTANAVAVLAFRARERLRQGYLAEHITLTGSPRCHWTGEHLPGYVRAGLAGRERTKVEDHLAECAECRRLHRELTEANVSLRVALAPLLLGAAAPGYLASLAAKGGLAGAWASLTAVVAAWWHGLIGGLARIAGDAWWWLTTLPKRLARRYGGPNVAAAGGLLLAAVLGVAVFVVSVVAHPGLPQSNGSTAAELPVPAPAEPPLLATTAPQPTLNTSPSPLPALSPTTSPTAKPHASPVGAPEDVSITPDPAGSSYVAGAKTKLPLVFSRTESGTRTEALTLADRSFTRTTEKSWTFELALPTGVTLAGSDAGDGWRCRGGSAVTCTRAEPGARTVAKVPIQIGPQVTGFQSVVLRFGGRSMLFRLPIAPKDMLTAFAGTGRLRTALGGNALLSCLPRPACLSSDNNALTMVPLLPSATEPGPPYGLFAPGGPTTPDGQLAELAGDKVASGALVAVPRGARVRWAGLIVGGSKAVPDLVVLHGPDSGWHPVRLVRFDGQAYADVTRLLQGDDGGAWWVAAAAAALPGGVGAYAGWSISVVYEQAGAPLSEVAVQLGPTALNRPDSEVTVRVRDRARVEVGLALWEGDRGLTGDRLLIGKHVVADNLARGESASARAVACASGGSCDWRTPGVDVLHFEGRADGGGISLRSGGDPLVLGLLAYSQEVDSR